MKILRVITIITLMIMILTGCKTNKIEVNDDFTIATNDVSIQDYK